MPKHWSRFLDSRSGDVGRALIDQGRRLALAQKELPATRYIALIEQAGFTARDASLLASCARSLGPLLDSRPNLRLPIRTRTLSALAEHPQSVLQEAAQSGAIHPSMTEADAKSLSPKSRQPVSPVIKPSDNWSFGRLQWPRIDGEDGHGYIPGDLYANCLWYYARSGNIVVDPMAGSGMLQKVWDDRDLWAAEDAEMELEIVMSDLIPRGPYSSSIQCCDLLQSFPVDKADYIVLDPPYCEIAYGQYSDGESDLANMPPHLWRKAMSTVAERLRSVQDVGGLCTVVVPNKRDLSDGRRQLFPESVKDIWRETGYELYDVVYSSRRIQRRQGRKMAILNNHARRKRVPLADMSEVVTFAAR